MKQFTQIMLAAVMAVFIAACSPIYSTSYELIPPSDRMGKACLMQCEQTKASCEQTNVLCGSVQENCESTAAIEKERCLARAGDNFHEKNNCDWNARTCNVCSKKDCESSYRTCFATCGGQVVPHQVCTAFCDKK